MDQQAFVALFREHLQDVSKYLVRRVPPNKVEDLASEIFEIAWRKKDACPKGFELAWLYKIAGFVVANHRRKAENKIIHLPLMDWDKAAPSAEDLALDGSDIAQAFAGLSASDRQVLSLLIFDGLSVAEIAVALGTSANTASQKLKRARQRLATNLDKQLSENQ